MRRLLHKYRVVASVKLVSEFTDLLRKDGSTVFVNLILSCRSVPGSFSPVTGRVCRLPSVTRGFLVTLCVADHLLCVSCSCLTNYFSFTVAESWYVSV